jgi:hypothetical protein
MLEKIASNSYYDIAVDVSGNRTHLTIKGFWETTELVQNFITDISAAGERMRPGFTVLANLTRMKPPPPEVCTMHEQAQGILLSCGLECTAEVVDDDSLEEMSRECAYRLKMKKQFFGNVVDAEAWLDSLKK